MGNKLARTTQVSASEYYLHDLPSSCNLVLKEALGGGRFLKSVLCLHDEGLLLVKVYFKRGEFPDLKEHEKRLRKIREYLKKIDHSHVWPFQYWLETDKAAYLLRQYFFSNLHDRISTRPFLSMIEKKWLAFQLLLAVKQSHERGVCHGDIKCENVLVTSWNWLYLADFASFKPTYLPVDNPADFSFFFDTGGRRRCYVAPERFYEPVGDVQGMTDGALKPAMDIFSLGCVVAELFLEGQALFDLSQLLAYRRGQYDPCPSLQKVNDVGIREMILHMIQLDPESRLSAEQYMQSWAPRIFPSYFSPLLHSFFSCLLPLDTDTRVAVTRSAFTEICKQMVENSPTNNNGLMSTTNFKDQSSLQVEKEKTAESNALQKGEVPISEGEERTHESESISPKAHSRFSLTPSHNELISGISALLRDGHSGAAVGIAKASSRHDKAIEKVVMQNTESYAPQDLLPGPQSSELWKCEGVVLIATLLCASLRHVKVPQARRGAIQLLHKCCLHIDDDTRLQHVLPYVVALLSDPAAIVRCAALQTVCNVLSLVQNFPPSDSKIFPEYILPLLSMLPDDPEESVRICYADNVHKIAQTACRFLECSQYMTELGVLDRSVHSVKGPRLTSPSLQHNKGKYDLELAQLRETIARVIQELVMGQKQTPTIRRALLQNVKDLCAFFGKKQCNDILLPILPAFLNDRDEQLRAVFFEHIVHVCLFVGQTSVEAYLLPYIEQALSDVEETVIVNSLECLAALCVNRLLRKRVLLGAAERSAPLLCHPSQWVRRSAITFVASAGANLNFADSRAFLLPILSPFLRREPVSLCLEYSLLACLKPPMSREAFNRVLSDVMLSQTESEKAGSKNSIPPSRIKQKPAVQQLPSDANLSKSSHERQKVEKDTTNTTSTDLRNLRASSTKRSPVASPVLQEDRPFTEPDDGEKMKAMEGYIRNLSSTMQSRMHNWELENSEKTQSSIVGMNTGVGAGFYPNHDGSSKDIPLYFVPLSDKRGDSQGSPSFSDEWNRIIAVRQGAQPFHMAGLSETPISPFVVSSQWTEGHSSMPMGLESQRQTGMSGSFSAKLMSGSVSGGSLVGPRRIYEVIRDVNAKDRDFGHMSSSLLPAVSAVRAKDSSALITQGYVSSTERGSGTVQPAETGIGQTYSASSMSDNQWRPRGILIAHLQEHQQSVNEVAVSHDSSFFVSASDDGTVKIWDCRRLESNISFRSRLTYSLQGGRALHVSMIGTGPQVAVASSSGVIHVFSVDYVARLGGNVERYSGFVDVKKMEIQEGAVLSLHSFPTDGPPMVIYSTQRNGIHLWDLRAQNDAWCLKAKPSQGYISATALGSCCNWLITATSRGVLTLWDLRFQIPVNIWQHPLNCPVEAVQPLLSQSDLAPGMSSLPYVYVAAGRNEVALWNAEDGSCHQVLRSAYDVSDPEVSEVPAALTRSKLIASAELKHNEGSKRSDYRLDELNEPPPRLPGVRALLPLSGGSGILTGGTDCKIRMWDRLRLSCRIQSPMHHRIYFLDLRALNYGNVRGWC